MSDVIVTTMGLLGVKSKIETDLKEMEEQKKKDADSLGD